MEAGNRGGAAGGRGGTDGRLADLGRDLVAGAVAGGFTTAMLFPLNTVKTRLMAGESLRSRGLLEGLWRGVRFDLVGQAVSTATFMGAYGRLAALHGTMTEVGGVEAVGGVGDDARHRAMGGLSSWSHGSSVMPVAAGASLIASLLSVPVEVVRQHVQARRYATPLQALRGILRQRGVAGLYHGYAYTLARDLPFDTIQMTIFQLLRAWALAATAESHLTAATAALLGGAAGAATGFLTTPLDALRTFQVLRARSVDVPLLSSAAAAAHMLHERGLCGLWRGAPVRCVEVAAGGVIFFSMLEGVQRLLPPLAR